MTNPSHESARSQLLGSILDRLCTDFENAWKAGQQPPIEEFLARRGTTAADVLLRELLHLELYYRGKRGDILSPAPYEGRFPGSQSLIAEVFAACFALAEFSDTSAKPGDDSIPEQLTCAFPLGSGPDQRPAPADAAPALPARIGRYRVERVLGNGGFGLVYLAYDEQLQRRVAVKVPHARRIARPGDLAFYLIEARTVANLDHPNIVPVYDVATTPDCPLFIVSKLIDGQDLSSRVKRSRLSPHEAAQLIADVAQALHYAHKRGVVHRDIKPGNILIGTNGEPYVVDFGLALREQEDSKESRFSGTPNYMSPEQVRGEGHRVDGRTDIFSLGVVLYEVLMGRRPFTGGSRQELFEKITTLDPKPLRQIDDTIHKELERICLKALSKQPADRYLTARDMARDLDRFARVALRSRRRVTWLAGAVVLATMIAAGALWPTLKSWLVQEPLRVRSFDVEHIAIVNNKEDPRGLIGKRSFSARLRDYVRFQAPLSRPAYAFVIAFRPDGKEELCFPEEDSSPPPLTDRPRYPSVSRGVRYGLDEGTGLWAFAVVASSKPLPAYRQWRSQQGPSPWKTCAAVANVVLLDDTQWLEILTVSGPVRGNRAKGAQAQESAPIVRVTDWLKQAENIEAVSVIGFGVRPNE